MPPRSMVTTSHCPGPEPVTRAVVGEVLGNDVRAEHAARELQHAVNLQAHDGADGVLDQLDVRDHRLIDRDAPHATGLPSQAPAASINTAAITSRQRGGEGV